MAGGWTQAAEGRAARCFLKAEGAGGFRPESQANLAGPGPQKEAARRGIRAAGCGCVKPRSRSNKCCRITSRCAGLGQTGCGRCGWLWLACAAPLRRVENGAFLRACRHFNSPCPAPVLSSLTGKGQPQRHGAARAEVAASSPVAGRLGEIDSNARGGVPLWAGPALWPHGYTPHIRARTGLSPHRFRVDLFCRQGTLPGG